MCGKTVFEVGSMFVGVGTLTKGAKVAKGGNHAKHPKYTEYVIERVNKITRKIEIQDNIKDAYIELIDKQLLDLTSELKTSIFEKSIKGGAKINAIF